MQIIYPCDDMNVKVGNETNLCPREAFGEALAFEDALGNPVDDAEHWIEQG